MGREERQIDNHIEWVKEGIQTDRVGREKEREREMNSASETNNVMSIPNKDGKYSI